MIKDTAAYEAAYARMWRALKGQDVDDYKSPTNEDTLKALVNARQDFDQMTRSLTFRANVIAENESKRVSVKPRQLRQL